MSSLSLPHLHLRQRPHSFYSTDTTGPYISASLGNSSRVHRRSSQTYRSSPLAGPVLSYDSLSALASLDSASGARKPSISQHGEGVLPGHGLINEDGRLMMSTQRSSSTGVLAEYSDRGSLGLHPPRPVWRHGSSRSILTAGSSNSISLSTASSASSTRSTRTLSSLISLSIPEVPQPHATHFVESHPSASEEQAHYSYSYLSAPSSSESSSSSTTPSRRHSRLSFAPPPSLSHSLSACSEGSTSISSVPSAWAREDTRTTKDCGLGREEAAEKQQRRSSLPVSMPTDIQMQTLKHDWLTATPTPVFSRSALKTQGVIMPVSARERGRVRSRCRTESNASPGRAASHKPQAISNRGNGNGSRSRGARSDVDKDKADEKTRTEDGKLEMEMANTINKSSARAGEKKINLAAAQPAAAVGEPETPRENESEKEGKPRSARIRRRWTGRSSILKLSRSPSMAAKIARRDTKTEVTSSVPVPDAEEKGISEEDVNDVDVDVDADKNADENGVLKTAPVLVDERACSALSVAPAAAVDCPSSPSSSSSPLDAEEELELGGKMRLGGKMMMGMGTKRAKRTKTKTKTKTNGLKTGVRFRLLPPGSSSAALVGIWRRVRRAGAAAFFLAS